MSKFSKNKRGFLIIILVLIIASGFLVWGAGTAKAVGSFEENIPTSAPQAAAQGAAAAKETSGIISTLISIPIKTVLLVVNFVLNLIVLLLTKVVYLGGYLVDAVLNIKQFSKAAIVTTGWQITRDLCNMFFALILLIMAFATILQIETWGLKKILWRLVVAALLINFSLVFAGIIIDFSQVFTNYFLDAARGGSSFSAQLMNGLGVNKFFNVDKDASYWQKVAETFNGGGAIAIQQIFGIIILLICAFSLFAFAFFLIVRIVMLWLLLIFAPLAWVSMIVPGKAHSLWEQWWSNFFKWVFFAPIYMFFLYLGLTMVKQNVITNQLAAQAVSSELGATFMDSFFGSPKAILQYIVLIIIMLGGLLAAQKFGIYGANGVMKLGKTMAGGSAKFVGGVAERWAAKGAKDTRENWKGSLRRGLSYLSPTAWKEGWKARQEVKKKEAFTVAAGARQDLFNRVLPGREKTDYKERAVRARQAEEEKNILTENAEEKIYGLENAKKKGNTEKVAAYLRSLTKPNDQNEILRHYNKSKENGGYGTNYTMDAEGWTSFMEEQMKPMMGEQATYRLGHDIVRIMEANGQWTGRSFGVDAKTGNYHIVGAGGKPITKSWNEMTNEEQKAAADKARSIAHVEWSKQDPQKQINTTGRFSYIIEGYGKNGETIDMGLTEEGKEKIAALEPAQSNRMHSHSKATLLYRHGKELKDINPALYKELLKKMKEVSKEMSDEDLKKYIKRNTTNIPELSENEMKNAVAMIRGEVITDGEAPEPSTTEEIGESPGTD